MNIWVGEKGAGLPTSLKDGFIKFRVDKPWMTENNINESIITLQWYDESWKPLYTVKVGEDNNYVYYKAAVTGFSFFAITEYAVDWKEEMKIPMDDEMQGIPNLRNSGELLLGGNLGENTVEKGTSIIKNPMGKAKALLAISLPLFIIAAGYGLWKRKI
jgi:hypothetical protein